MITIAATNPMINQALSSRITAALIHMDNIHKIPLQLLQQLIQLSNKTTNTMGSNINIQLQEQAQQQQHLHRSICQRELLEVTLAVIHSISNILKVTSNNSMPSSITNKEYKLSKMHIHNSNSSIPRRLKLLKRE